MKKVIICLLLAIAACNCEVKVKDAKAQTNTIPAYKIADIDADGTIKFLRYNIDGMDYGIFTAMPADYRSGVSMVIINLTKDSLEVARLKNILPLNK
jgi:hypothetical protein